MADPIFTADRARGFVECDGGSFALVGFNGFVGREDELADAIAALANATVERETFTLAGTPFVFPAPSTCKRCGGHDFHEIRRGDVCCNTCDPVEEDHDD